MNDDSAARPTGPTLQCRGTFIDVVERPTSAARSHSDPVEHQPHGLEASQAQQSYVEFLQERTLISFAPFAGSSSRAASGSRSEGQVKDSSDSCGVYQNDFNLEMSWTSAPVRQEVARCSQGLPLSLSEAPAYDGPTPWPSAYESSPVTLCLSSHLQCSGTRSSSEVPSLDIPAVGTTCNYGSLGHPDLCARPCNFYSRGMCANANSCGYCHMQHSQPLKIHKRQLQLLASLGTDERLVLCLPIMRQRAEELGFGEQAAQFFQLVELRLETLRALHGSKTSLDRPAPESDPNYPSMLDSLARTSFRELVRFGMGFGCAPHEEQKSDPWVLVLQDGLAALRTRVYPELVEASAER